MRQFLLKFGVLSFLVVILGPISVAQTNPKAYTLTTTLAGSNVATPVETDASGNVIAVLIGHQLIVTGTYQDLSSPLAPDGASVGIAPPGEELGLVLLLAEQGTLQSPGSMTLTDTGGTSGTFSGVFTLTDKQRDELGNDLFYVQLDTLNHIGGELRGQITSEIDFGFSAEDMVGSWRYAGGVATYRADGTASAGGRTGNWTFEDHILTWTNIQGKGCSPEDVDVYYVEGFHDGSRRSRDVSIECDGFGGGWNTLWKVQ